MPNWIIIIDFITMKGYGYTDYAQLHIQSMRLIYTTYARDYSNAHAWPGPYIMRVEAR